MLAGLKKKMEKLANDCYLPPKPTKPPKLAPKDKEISTFFSQ